MLEILCIIFIIERKVFRIIFFVEVELIYMFMRLKECRRLVEMREFYNEI